jgi:CopG family transcriptional regulator/antitoxin EndoAI
MWTTRSLPFDAMSRRINVILPEATIQTIDRMAKPGERSRFIDQAVRHYVANRSVEALRAQLEHTAVRDRDLDRDIAAEWSAVDQEAWQHIEETKPQRRPATRSAEKYTSRRSIRR